ncbi:uncharacterized protein HD556DRAFT_1442739 [Suillus plorans]|uniref:Uncharacterized protein n=1 Tax=Suillus plorans TaxID=116603 RepID=A0A9P7DHG9_9AGAM|nr:uncharacterized protein HD556DRAFT_1442739 [Suillus plorans]KAG1794552.1 hypothetical protein HD556DRAFT_1442739 [Suillus plorans]
MECSIRKCSAAISVQEGQEVKLFDGMPVCEKCDAFLHAPLPTFTRKTESVKKPYEESEAYKKEVIHDGRALLDYPAHLPFPKQGHGVRRIQVPDKEGGMRYKYITRRVESKK